MITGILLPRAIIGGIIIALLYVSYRLSLARLNAPALNRRVIIAIYLMAIAASFAWLPLGLDNGAPSTPASLSAASPVVATIAPVLPALRIASMIYLCGVVIMLLATILSWLRLSLIIARGTTVVTSGRHKITIIDNNSLAPFSWMGRIIMSRHDYDNAPSSILAHEMQHVSLRHHLDLLLAQCVIILNWFNPAAWLLLRELRAVHEYQADSHVLDSGTDSRDYQLMLIHRAARQHSFSLVNAFSNSPLRNRIVMMDTPVATSAPRRLFLFLPALAAATVMLASPGLKDSLNMLAHTKAGIEITDAPDVYVNGHQLIDNSDVQVFLNNERTTFQHINTIDPSTIESISVSKDPDAKIFIKTTPQ